MSYIWKPLKQSTCWQLKYEDKEPQVMLYLTKRSQTVTQGLFIYLLEPLQLLVLLGMLNTAVNFSGVK